MKRLGSILFTLLLIVVAYFLYTVYEIKSVVPEQYHDTVVMYDEEYMLPKSGHIGVRATYTTFEGEEKTVYLKSMLSVKYLNGEWDFYRVKLNKENG